MWLKVYFLYQLYLCVEKVKNLPKPTKHIKINAMNRWHVEDGLQQHPPSSFDASSSSSLNVRRFLISSSSLFKIGVDSSSSTPIFPANKRSNFFIQLKIRNSEIFKCWKFHLENNGRIITNAHTLNKLSCWERFLFSANQLYKNSVFVRSIFEFFFENIPTKSNSKRQIDRNNATILLINRIILFTWNCLRCTTDPYVCPA